MKIVCPNTTSRRYEAHTCLYALDLLQVPLVFQHYLLAILHCADADDFTAAEVHVDPLCINDRKAAYKILQAASVAPIPAPPPPPALGP